MTDKDRLYKGYRLLAADGSDIQIPTNPKHEDSYFSGANGQDPYSLLHLDAVYDLLQHTYVDVAVCGRRDWNEKGVLCNMVDRSNIAKALVIADRGYESYDLMAHVQEKGWKYLIRIKDIHSSGIACGLDLPDRDVFDMAIDLNLRQHLTIKYQKWSWITIALNAIQLYFIICQGNTYSDQQAALVRLIQVRQSKHHIQFCGLFS